MGARLSAVDPLQSRVKVVYIVSYGRSGSTILGNILGELDGFFHAGELRTLWGQGLLRGRLCGCGREVRDCPFWSAVLDRALSPTGLTVAPTDIERLHAAAVQLRYLPRMLIDPAGRPPPRRHLQTYARCVERLYRAIAHVAEARVVVDSSKHPGDGAVLRYAPDLEPYFVQLVRDPRAVAYSWQRRKHSPGERARQEMMRLGAARSSKNWVVINLGAEAIRGRQPSSKTLLLRYESFVADPRRALDAVLDMIHEDPAPATFLDDRRVRLSAGHTAGGNPDRFKAGTVELREDTEWRSRQAPSDRRIATAVALPLLWRYGYPVRVSPSGAG